MTNSSANNGSPADLEAACGMRWMLPFAIGSTVIVFASAFVGIRVGLRGYSPVHLAVLRFITASALFGIRALLVGICIPERRDRPLIFLTGLLGFTIYALLVNFGETRVRAGMASFVVNMVPVFTVILAVLFLGERMRALGWMGLAVSMSGAALLSYGTTSRLAFEPYFLVLVLAAIVQAVYFALQKPLLDRYGGVAVTSWTVWAGTACLLPFLPSAVRSAFATPASATFAAVYLGALPTFIGYAVWGWVVSKMPVGRATTFLYFVPVAATLIGWLILQERPTFLGLLGGMIAISGVALVNLRARSVRTQNVTASIRSGSKLKQADAVN